MKSVTKRLVAFALCICMTLGTCTVSNAAGDETVSDASEVVTAEEDSAVDQVSDDETMSDTAEVITGEVITAEEDSVAEQVSDETVSDTAEITTTEEDSAADQNSDDATIENDEKQEENSYSDTSNFIGMDEEGNIYTIEVESDGVVLENPRMRAAGPQIVNFRARADGTAIPTTTYVTYTEYKTGKSGSINGLGGADAAYLGTTSDGKVKFMMSGVIGLVDASEVQVVHLSSVESYSYYYADGTNLYHCICTDMTTPGYASKINVGPQPSYLKKGTYYSYDGHYFYTDYSTMLSDYSKDTRAHAVNSSKPYYNYFQYLPLRSTTDYSVSTLNSIINSYADARAAANGLASSKMHDTGSTFVSHQNTYGVNALIMTSVGAIESAWGTSPISQNKNNLFGLNAVDATPGQSANYYSSVSQCIKEFAETWMSKGYLNVKDWRYNGGFLGNKASGCNVRYATDPYWGEKIAGIAWNLDNSNGKTNQYKYTIGIKDTLSYEERTNLNVRKEATTTSTRLYQTGTASDYAFIVLGESGSFYKIQSDAVLSSGRSGVDTSTGVYNISNMYAYASKDYITVVSQGVYTGAIKIGYSAHVQDYGWQGYVYDGNTAGTTGKAKRIEAIKINMSNAQYSGSVTYRTHVQDHGWMSWVKDGAVSGTTGESKQVEAIQIKLTGDVANKYDIYYRTHVKNIGWMDWAKNGEAAGTTGQSKQVEAIQMVLIEKGKSAPGSTSIPAQLSSQLKYSGHSANVGWGSYVSEGATAGTTGRSLRLESIKISLNGAVYSGSISYKAHVQNIGWQDWVKDGAVAGTTGQAKQIEAVCIQLSGEIAQYYDVYYRAHVSGYGWLDWAKNGQSAGTTGLAKQMEAIQIVLVKKGNAAPGATTTPYRTK